MEKETELPNGREIDYRHLHIFATDIDTRLRDLTYLVALQETELSILWMVIAFLSGYILIKEYHDR